MRWYEMDMNWYGIWTLKKLGLARHVYRVKLSELDRRSKKQKRQLRLTGVGFGLRHYEKHHYKTTSLSFRGA